MTAQLKAKPNESFQLTIQYGFISRKCFHLKHDGISTAAEVVTELQYSVGRQSTELKTEALVYIKCVQTGFLHAYNALV